MNRLALALAATLGLSAPALAQAPARPAAPPAATPAPAAPAAAQPSASHLALARELVNVTGMARSFDPMIPALQDQLKQAMVTRPELTKDLNEVLDGMKGEMEQQRQLMLTTAARIYTSALTEAEMKEILAFFKSPAGARYVTTQPTVLDGLVREMQAWSQNVAEYLMIRVRAEMGKRGHAVQ